MKLAALALALAACDSGSYYLYTASQYDSRQGCVTAPQALDVEIGNDPGSSCGAKCLTAPGVDGGAVVYASTMCGPTPVGADVSGSNPMCAAAIAALESGDFCLDGGAADAGAD